MRGDLGSCVSCVEHHYYQSTSNATIFLEACASAGLMQKVPLLDLFGYVGPRVDPGQDRYDEPIYISAPEFQAADPQASRTRLDLIKKQVNSALRTFLEELRADDDAVAAAYEEAVVMNMLKEPAIAAKRFNVKMSSLAMVRLILYGFTQAYTGDKSEKQRVVIGQTTQFVRRFVGATPKHVASDDVGAELEQFAVEFLSAPEKIHELKIENPPRLSDDYWLKWLPVLLSIAWGRSSALKAQGKPEAAERFSTAFSRAAQEGAQREESGGPASRALTSLIQEWEWMNSDASDMKVPSWLLPIIGGSTTVNSAS